ncbi:MAG: carbohydrate porin, partial [Stellaceae bacterium]
MTLCVGYLGEAFSDVSGGVRHGTIYEDHLELTLGIDLEKVVPNTVFRARAFRIDGRGLSANYLGNNLLTISGFEAERATRLFDLWIENQPIKDQVSIKFGQFSADDEFIISSNGAIFVNSTFGWPGKEAADLPSGGPAFPLSTPGVRIKAQPTDQWSLMAAVFNGDPAGPGSGTPQSRDASGTAFRLDDGAFAIAELAYQLDGSDRPDGIKLGSWYHTGRFADQRLDSLGRSLASPASSHVAAQHRGDYGFYGIVDRMIWRAPRE